jgi:hypothetical protein
MNSITGGNRKIRRAVENVWRRRRRKVRGAPARRRKWVAAANKNSARRRRALHRPNFFISISGLWGPDFDNTPKVTPSLWHLSH